MLVRIRVALDCSLPAERVLLALRGEPFAFALTGRWAGGGAIVGCAPARVLGAGEDPFEALEDLPGAARRRRGRRRLVRLARLRAGRPRRGAPAAPAAPVPAPRRPPRVLRPCPAAGQRGPVVVRGARRRQRRGGDAARERRVAARLLARRAPRAARRPAARPRPRVLAAPARRGRARGRGRGLRRADRGRRDLPGQPLPAARRDLRRRRRRALRRTPRRSCEPAYGACFLTPWGGIASLSPELFLRRRGRTVTTGPIKGTAPRSDPAALRALREGPRRARDDRRPDAQRPRARRRLRHRRARRRRPRPSRTPASGTSSPRSRAELAPGHGDAALLRATFPPGSVTGAPKVQALHVISAARGHRPRGLHRRDRLRQPARRPRAQRRHPHLRSPRRPPLARRGRRNRRRL